MGRSCDDHAGDCGEPCASDPDRYCGRMVSARLVRPVHDWIIFTCPVELPPAMNTLRTPILDPVT
jgi:hypothetical protein